MHDGFDVALAGSHEEYVEKGCDNMEMLAHGQKAKEEEKGDIMDKIHGHMQALEETQGRGFQHTFEEPGQGQRCHEMVVDGFLERISQFGCFKQTFGNHQGGDDAQNKYGFSSVGFTIFFRHFVTGWFDDKSAVHGINSHAKHPSAGVRCQDAICLTDETMTQNGKIRFKPHKHELC